MSRYLPIVLFAAACSSASAAPDSCTASALGISNAQPLLPWTPPVGCTVQHPPARALVSSQSDLTAMFHCPSGVSPQLDFTQNSLVVVTQTASGIDAYDDGSKVTVVEKASCAKQAAKPTTSYFVIAAAKASRNFGDATCAPSPNCQ